MLRFAKEEIRLGLLGGLEAALLMRQAAGRFANDRDSALRSFIIPILLSTLTLAGIYMFPRAELAHHSVNMIAILYSSRLVLSWVIYFACIYWLAREVGRKEYFWRFVAANNWLSIPATVIFAPVAWSLLRGTHSWDEMSAIMVMLTLYSYVFTAYAAALIFRVPWELGAFIALIGLLIHENTGYVIGYVGSIL